VIDQELDFSVSKYMCEVPQYHYGSARFFVYNNDFISAVLQRGHVWEQHMQRLFERVLTKDSVVIDGGAHIGAHTVKLSRLAKYVHAFEPLTPTFDLLDKNLGINGCRNVTAYRQALSNSVGNSSYGWIENGNLGGAGLSQSLEEGSEFYVDTVTIDSLGLDQLDFIKLDIEGYEQQAIEGGMKTISKFLPMIALECWDEYPNSSLERAKMEYGNLLELGYSVTRVEDGSPDYLFVHESRGPV
jgi:FkbM family methyltransferase